MLSNQVSMMPIQGPLGAKCKEIEASLLASISNVGNKEAAAMAAAVRAVGGDSLLDDSFARERISSVACHICTAELARRAEQVYFSFITFDACKKFCKFIRKIFMDITGTSW
ncbi:hypothetical protein Cni_G06848 [Canna indica]|uniref:Uncharacterized protein n=1 Tax=Canna indica TaxID=4628 RepID=A0AAQ3Q560_9LILI|nr:hypothetical protein Cni_G06848 [Canna indica]